MKYKTPSKMNAFLIVLGILFIGFVVIQLWALNSQKNIETYSYTVKKKYGDFEIRNYDASLFTSVQLSTKGFKNSSSEGFSKLAGYIFGANEKNQKIAMTSPVAMSLTDSVTMMFMVPKHLQKETLPKPNQSDIQFKEVPPKTVAAIGFKGWANDTSIERYKQQLMSALEKEGISYTKRFYFFGYNAPFEVFNRKNEIIVELN